MQSLKARNCPEAHAELMSQVGAARALTARTSLIGTPDSTSRSDRLRKSGLGIGIRSHSQLQGLSPPSLPRLPMGFALFYHVTSRLGDILLRCLIPRSRTPLNAMLLAYTLPLLAMRLVVPAVFRWTDAPEAVANSFMRATTAAGVDRFSKAMRYAARPQT
jgi:hypothetical protein